MPRAIVSQSLILDTNLMVACLAFEARLGGAPILNNNYKFPALFPPSLPSLSFSNRSREGEREGIIMRPQTGSLLAADLNLLRLLVCCLEN